MLPVTDGVFVDGAETEAVDVSVPLCVTVRLGVDVPVTLLVIV